MPTILKVPRLGPEPQPSTSRRRIQPYTRCANFTPQDCPPGVNHHGYNETGCNETPESKYHCVTTPFDMKHITHDVGGKMHFLEDGYCLDKHCSIIASIGISVVKTYIFYCHYCSAAREEGAPALPSRIRAPAVGKTPPNSGIQFCKYVNAVWFFYLYSFAW